MIGLLIAIYDFAEINEYANVVFDMLADFSLNNYNKFVGSFERNVISAGRRLRDLGAAEILEELKTIGFAHIPSSISQDILKQCTDAFREFIKNTPLIERTITDFRYDPSQRFNLGFRDKSTNEGFDEKCYFHFNPHIREK